MMEQKLDPPTYFLSSCFHLQSNYNYEISEKKLADYKRKRKMLKGDKVV